MAQMVGTFVIWAVVLSLGIPLAIFALYQIYRARIFLFVGVLLIAIAVGIYFYPEDALVLGAALAGLLLMCRLFHKFWSLDKQVEAKTKADRIGKGYVE